MPKFFKLICWIIAGGISATLLIGIGIEAYGHPLPEVSNEGEREPTTLETFAFMFFTAIVVLGILVALKGPDG